MENFTAPERETIDRLMGKVDKTSTCWLWTAGRNAAGYGVFGWRRKTWLAHRAAYTLLVGPIPEGLTLDHLCHTPPCVNPDHLEPVTLAENQRRSAWAHYLYCRKGHRYAPENTYWRSDGYRECRACRSIKGARRRALAKGVAV